MSTRLIDGEVKGIMDYCHWILLSWFLGNPIFSFSIFPGPTFILECEPELLNHCCLVWHGLLNILKMDNYI